MEEVNATILSYIKKANDAFISGDSVQAYNYVLRAAECTLTQAKSCVGVKREKFLKTYNELKIMLARLPKQEQNNNITASEELKTSGTFTKGTSDETVGGETRTRKPLISDALNPQYLSDYIGQPQAVTAVKDLIDAALLKDTAMPHIILYGSHGLGKTTFARIIANEMRTRFVEINASKITVPEMISVLKKNQAQGYSFYRRNSYAAAYCSGVCLVFRYAGRSYNVHGGEGKIRTRGKGRFAALYAYRCHDGNRKNGKALYSAGHAG